MTGVRTIKRRKTKVYPQLWGGGHRVGFKEKVKDKQGSEDLAKHVSERRQPWRWEQVFQACREDRES